MIYFNANCNIYINEIGFDDTVETNEFVEIVQHCIETGNRVTSLTDFALFGIGFHNDNPVIDWMLRLKNAKTILDFENKKPEVQEKDSFEWKDIWLICGERLATINSWPKK